MATQPPPPMLTVSANAGPSTPSPKPTPPLPVAAAASATASTGSLSATIGSAIAPVLPKRPQGARRRGPAPGLFIANPDNSDDDEHSPSRSPVRASPVRNSPIRASPVTASSSSSVRGVVLGGGGGGGGGSGGNVTGSISFSTGSPNQRPLPLPTIPAPNSSPLPSVSTFSSPQFIAPTPQAVVENRPVPPQPPPQPERHLRRAFTTPEPPKPSDSRPPGAGTSSNSYRDVPSSPSRALPPLPPINSSVPSVSGPGASPQSTSHQPLLPTGVPPTPSSSHSAPAFMSDTTRVASPDDVLSPTATSDSTGSISMESRTRSGSVHQKMLLQVTTDNEQFAVVDITNVFSADGIRERIFSRLRFRDNDYSSLSIFRTDIGESPDPTPLPPQALLQLCQTYGDSKANLKFLVVQTSVPDSSSASVIPPPPDTDSAMYRVRGGVTPITTDFAPAYTPRASSRHSKDGSLSSASESMDRSRASAVSAASASDWSDFGATDDPQIHRATRGLPWTHSNSSRSPIAEATSINTSSPALHPTLSTQQSAPPHELSGSSPSLWDRDIDLAPLQIPDESTYRPGFSTPTPRESNPVYAGSMLGASSSNAVAGPSRSLGHDPSGLGLNIDLAGMDPETAALVLQMQREDEEARQREEERIKADEQIALKEQQSEREVWQMMQQLQMEQQRQRQEQVRRDAARAREVDAEQRRVEDERLRNESEATARAAWDTDTRERDRGSVFAQERRERREHFQNQSVLDGVGADWTLVGDDSGRTTPFQTRRPSESHLDRASNSTYSLGGGQVYTSPQSQFSAEVPSSVFTARRPSGYSTDRFSETSHAQERLSDPRLQQVTGRQPPPQPLSLPNRRQQNGRNQHPYTYANHEEGTIGLQGVRSMDNLRPFTAPNLVLRPAYQGVPPRTSRTPVPDYSSFRSPSQDRVRDGRYPEPPSASARSVQNYDGSIVRFPSPRATGSILYHDALGAATSDSIRRPYDVSSSSSPRPQTYYGADGTTSPVLSPGTATLGRRPNTLYDPSPPGTAQADYLMALSPHSRPRSGSESGMYSATYADGSRRTSDPGTDTQLPYALPLDDEESNWLSVPLSSRRRTDTSDTASVAGTTISDATTIRAYGRNMSGDDVGDDSTATARASDDWRNQLRNMISEGGGTLNPTSFHARRMLALDDDDGEEATLFITPPTTMPPESSGVNSRLPRSPSRPSLTVNTGARRWPNSASDSESADEGQGSGVVRRSQSFARPRDQWHFRPEPEQLYDNLQQFFPKIDLDKPFVDPALSSTPSTPSSESPKAAAEFKPPPVHPSRLSQSQQPNPIPEVVPVRTPSQNPARAAVAAVAAAFNKSEYRKSIRNVADHKKKSLQRANHGDDVSATREDKRVRRSSSMWGHKVVEVTPSKMLMDVDVPAVIPESPSADGKPATLNWVKGELIGKGSYGRVYIALNVTTGDMMAVKQVEMPATEQDRNDRRQLSVVEALQSEISLLKDLYHPNIVAYLGCEASLEYLSIFLEYVPGGTIASIYRTPNQARFEEQLVKFFTMQILEGLAYLHAKHIWHRDLKGDNILVDAMGVCKISDFGISKQTTDAYDSFGQATNMKGSIFWMAPEVIHSPNERSYSGKVDIWSLGCVVLEMWSGQRPWGALEQFAAMYELFSKRSAPPLPDDIHLSPVALDFMYQKCLAKDPRDRPVARDLLEHEFITDTDPAWTFADSKIGKAVAKRAPKTVRSAA